ncbi:penicillin acylase family protein [Streptomyces winkii]|uniref:penicillin acylase family protein n=1 Tax=Streptomyces winkii TaxID=3051178 RepID=UPI0028D67E27|nr:penicillin acylase family protein [Streptomyces sp. DSM 40971]
MGGSPPQPPAPSAGRVRTGADGRRTGVDDGGPGGPAARGGSGDTVGAAPYASAFRQSGGATFRLVVDVGSWDESLAMNSPGQSGDPGSRHYRDLFGAWAGDAAFPLLYSRSAVEAATEQIVTLEPAADGA